MSSFNQKKKKKKTLQYCVLRNKWQTHVLHDQSKKVQCLFVFAAMLWHDLYNGYCELFWELANMADNHKLT